MGGSNSGTYDVPVTRFDVARLIMPDISKISDITTYHDDNDDFEIEKSQPGEGAKQFYLRRKDGFCIRFVSNPFSFGFSCHFESDAEGHNITVASALILSELVNGVWKRSSSNLVVPNGADNPLVKKVFSFDQWASLYAS